MKDGRYDSFYLMHYKACILLQGPVRDGAVPSMCYVAQVFSKHFFPTMNFFLQNIHSLPGGSALAAVAGCGCGAIPPRPLHLLLPQLLHLHHQV